MRKCIGNYIKTTNNDVHTIRPGAWHVNSTGKSNISWTNKHLLSEPEYIYPDRAQKTCPKDKYARFRMSLKAHKTPRKMRPIVCCAGTFLNGLSRWLDFQLRKLTRFIPTYLKDSNDLLRQLKSLGRLFFVHTTQRSSFSICCLNVRCTGTSTSIQIMQLKYIIGEWIDSLTWVLCRCPVRGGS